MKRQCFLLVLMGIFLCSISVYSQTNLLDTSTWTVGTGSVPGFVKNGADAENVRELGLSPHGDNVVLWKAVPDGSYDADGGWNGSYVNIDHTKTYRFSIWIKKTNSFEGTTYFGLYTKDAVGNHTTLLLNNTPNNIPYFWAGDPPQLNKWYLLIGFVHSSSYAGTTAIGGVYDGVTGVKVLDGQDFKFTVNATRLMHRTYLWFISNTSDRQFFYAPTIYEVNGQEPTIQELIDGPNGGPTDTQAPTAPTLSSTGQTDTTADLSWIGATDDTAVTGYKVYKDGALETTLGNVSTYQITGLTESSAYSFTATALDDAGNESSTSNALSITTDSSGGGSSGGTVWTEANSVASYSGNVAVGTATVPSGYQMAVDGKLITEEVKVQLSGNWPDYVFKEGYDLPTLDEVKKHIDEKGHLIHIPSAEEVEANGIQLGEMNKLLLEKIEELTLYVLQQQNEIGELQKENQELADLRKKVILLENRMKNINQ